MSEKEKMLTGQAYIASGDELSQERLAAKEILYDINHARPSEKEKRKELFHSLLGGVKGDFTIESPFKCDYGYNIFIGDYFYANSNMTILDCGRVLIGDEVMCGPNVSLFTAGHPIDADTRAEGWEFAEPIIIGDKVWIGGNSVINPGVKIGDNTVIGSGSVVTKDIPDNVIAVGNPCRVLREITEADKASFLTVYR